MRAQRDEGLASLTMGLFAPGMTILHRAGLGGLAATLRSIERNVKSRGLRASPARAVSTTASPRSSSCRQLRHANTDANAASRRYFAPGDGSRFTTSV